MFVWLKNTSERYDHQQGINCSIFRNESPTLSSLLIAEADEIGWQRWPAERHWTYVNAARTTRGRSRNSPPGKCFIEAGWRQCGLSKEGLVILERLP